MTSDPRVGPALDRALKLIAADPVPRRRLGLRGRARRQRGHDLSLAVMQAKALRSAVDSGLEVPPEVIELAIRERPRALHAAGLPARNANEEEQKKHPGPVHLHHGRPATALAMAAAGVVCLQEFAQYDDWRIAKNMENVKNIEECREAQRGPAQRPGAVRRRLHAVLRRPGPVPGGRRALEELLPAAARPPGVPARSGSPTSPTATAGGGRASGSAASPGSCTRRPSPVSCWPCPIVTCRSCRKERSKVCGEQFEKK